MNKRKYNVHKNGMISGLTADILDGFELVDEECNALNPVITLDKFSRFYLNVDTRALTGVRQGDKVVLMYNASERSIALITDVQMLEGRYNNVQTYRVDSRHYVRVKAFYERYRYDTTGAPFTFEYDVEGSSVSDGVFTFRLRE